MAATRITTKDQPLPTVDRKSGVGHIQYKSVKVSAGETVECKILVDGVEVGTLGPWVAEAKTGRAGAVTLRMVVDDNADLKAFEEPIP